MRGNGNNGDGNGNGKGKFCCPRCGGKFSSEEFFFFCDKLKRNGNKEAGDCYFVPDNRKHGLFSRIDAIDAINGTLKTVKSTR